MLRHINPVNESASDAYWRNDSTPITRICPSIVTPVDLGIPDGASGNTPTAQLDNDPGNTLDLVVIGTNFDTDVKHFCRFEMDVSTGGQVDGLMAAEQVLVSGDGQLRAVTFTQAVI